MLLAPVLARGIRIGRLGVIDATGRRHVFHRRHCRPAALVDTLRGGATCLAGTRSEPTLSREPLLIGFDEEPGDPAAAPTSSGGEASPAIGVLGSLAVHLWPLLFLLEWNFAPGQIPPPILVQLVIEQSAPEPVSVTQPAPTPPPGLLASDDFGVPAPEPDKQTITAAARPTKPASATPTRAPTQTIAKPPAVSPQRVARATRLPGPLATRDEYMAHCLSLLRRHYGMVPPSLLVGRSGQAVLSLLVLGDGTIARITVAQSSGFPNLDRRLEEMVAAIRSFPPPPQWPQGAMPMTYRVVFADGRLR